MFGSPKGHICAHFKVSMTLAKSPKGAYMCAFYSKHDLGLNPHSSGTPIYRYLYQEHITYMTITETTWAAISAAFLAVWAVVNQLRNHITADSIHYTAMYIPDKTSFR